MKRSGYAIYIFVLFLALNGAAFCQERHRLYTETDPENTGGFKGRISKPARPIEQILAMPPDEPRFVYKGTVTGNDNQGFLFTGMPMCKYDLFVIYEDEFYEGLELNKNVPSSLNEVDLKKIQWILTESDPYFLKKTFYRIEGITGRGNFSRVVCGMLRDEGGKWRHTYKLVWLKDVGPGWQVVQKRDLYPAWIDPKNAAPKHHYTEALSKIRVAGDVKDIGDLDLVKTTVPTSIKAAVPGKPAATKPAPTSAEKEAREREKILKDPLYE